LNIVITRVHKPSLNRTTIKRRLTVMVRDVNRALMYACIGRKTDDFFFAEYQAELPSLTTYTLNTRIPTDDTQTYLRVVEYLTAIKKKYSIHLTPPPGSVTITPCESHHDTPPTDPQPAMSAT
jgi:hypothetical protein